MTVTRRIGPEEESAVQRRRRWSRVASDVSAYVIAVCVAAGFIAEWPIEITREGARAIRRGDPVGEAEERWLRSPAEEA